MFTVFNVGVLVAIALFVAAVVLVLALVGSMAVFRILSVVVAD
jgi:hypothetical protein